MGTSTSRKEIVVDHDLMYALTRNENGVFFIEVVRGGIAMENIVIPLLASEYIAYLEEGKIVLDDLAKEIARGSRRFDDRRVR